MENKVLARSKTRNRKIMTPKEKAQQLYNDAYMRWCHELSHDKNVLTAKDICIYICNEVLGYMGADRGYEFWTEVKQEIKKL
jgi:hypothetical protein